MVRLGLPILLLGAIAIVDCNPLATNPWNELATKDVNVQLELVDDPLIRQQLAAFGGDGLWFPDDNGNPVRATLEGVELLGNDDNFVDTVSGYDTKVLFLLYTKETNGHYEPIHVNDKPSLQRSHFDPKRPTKIVTHGWINSYRSPATTRPRDAFLQSGDYNVIVVDWSKFTLRPYVYATSHVKQVGKFVAQMVDFLEENGMDLKDLTLVGHSLGAHVVGLASYYAKGKPYYVVGLDPALPLFVFAGPGSRISTEDAHHVEIIHTNGGLLGFLAAIGHYDFYPNGGTKQIGCLIDLGGVCSHTRAFDYFAESLISQNGFYARKCGNFLSWTLGRCNDEEMEIMGGFEDRMKLNGTYYLGTKRWSPYAKGAI